MVKKDVSSVERTTLKNATLSIYKWTLIFFREQNPRPFKSSGKSKKDDSHGMQRTNPSFVPEPGVNDDLVYGKVKCDNDQEKYYNPRCFTFEGSGNLSHLLCFHFPWKNLVLLKTCSWAVIG